VTRNVSVLLGGPSAEHDVSLVSGRAIAAALAGRGHRVEGWLIGLDGAWWRLPSAALDEGRPQTDYDDPAALGADGPHEPGAALSAIAAADERAVVFIALHGPFGEDGTVQALCEAAELTYTGSGVAASAVGMDKSLFKRLVGGMGMPIVPWRDVTLTAWLADQTEVHRRLVDFALELPDPRLIVKPARLGSSVGITIVHRPGDPGELGAAVESALAHDELVLAEAYLDHARELEVSVVGNGATDVEVFGPGEIFPGREFYDYEAKYEPGVSRTTDRPQVEPRLRAQLKEIARRAFLVIGASGFARVDFLVGGGVLYLNEINTIPGFTPISLFPVLCREGGYDFAAITERIVELAVARDAQRRRRALTRADLP
jgi:D-alanine-D-alanine ligase